MLSPGKLRLVTVVLGFKLIAHTLARILGLLETNRKTVCENINHEYSRYKGVH